MMNNTLDKITKLESDASSFGLNWDKATQIMAQIMSECDEIKEHLHDEKSPHLQEEIGDLIHAAFSLCVFCNFDPEETLNLSLNKFNRRLQAAKTIAQEKGLDTLKGLEFDELMEYWKAAKNRVG